eukprot:CAMPEP_0175565350 /NCGR_PEP_ID=MMETSP0096-20121207/39398_1 /TAXON_ID=311494 /ORGANISM="Alexandrium monilatum, Strain CCMP3105" /LENGTH=331 /DNA_ID=CAMNT_0016868633 /DNA_START=33 /DNA_END=1024 /DNA_ORIENTATION=-
MAASRVVTPTPASPGNDTRELRRLGALEDALAREIGRQTAFESWAATKVEVLVDDGLRMVHTAVEDKLTELHRRFEEEFLERLTAVEQKVGAAIHRIAHSEQGAAARRVSSPEGCDGMTRVSRRKLSSLEDRIAWFERRMSKPLQTINLEVAKNLKLIRTQILDESAERCQQAIDASLADSSDVRQRLNELQLWLIEAVVPMVVEARIDLQKERRERERAIAELSGPALNRQDAQPLPAGSRAAPEQASLRRASAPRDGDLPSEDAERREAATEPAAAAIAAGGRGGSRAAGTPSAGDADGRGAADEDAAAAEREAHMEGQQRRRQLTGRF